MDGELVKTHGRQGSDIGELQYPFLTGSDEFNNILIAGNANHRMDVLKADGQFQSLPLAGLGKNPMCARLHRDKLFVALWYAKTLQVFSIANI